MKVIFLDIDGVLNWNGTEDRIDGFVGLCTERIERFNKIIEAHPDAQIVISSTWRICSAHNSAYKNFGELKQLLVVRGLKGEIIGHTPINFGSRGRGSEIREWLNGKEDLIFVILDDDLEGMAPFIPFRRSWETDKEWDERQKEIESDLRPYHVITTWKGTKSKSYAEPSEEGGLQDWHIEQAIKILNGELLQVEPPTSIYKDSTWE